MKQLKKEFLFLSDEGIQWQNRKSVGIVNNGANMKTVARESSTDGVTAHKATPTACYGLINSGIRNIAPHLLTPRGKSFSNTPVCIYVLSSYFILMLRATLHAVVGPLNHNQLNLVHVCLVLELAAGGTAHRRHAKLCLQWRREGWLWGKGEEDG